MHSFYEALWIPPKNKLALGDIVRVRPVVCHTHHWRSIHPITCSGSPLVPEGCRHPIQAMTVIFHHKIGLKPSCGGPGFFREGPHPSLPVVPYSTAQCREIWQEQSSPQASTTRTPGRSLTPTLCGKMVRTPGYLAPTLTKKDTTVILGDQLNNIRPGDISSIVPQGLTCPGALHHHHQRGEVWGQGIPGVCAYEKIQ
jgi:hypothetical protein